jgi:hypothetical protein
MIWEQGRQKTGYLKKCLINSKLFKFDMYLLKYPEGSEIPRHLDSAIIPFHEHHRINVVLQKPKEGGEFFITDNYDNDHKQSGRFFYFRPDLKQHGVLKITKGTRYVLSIGWSIMKRKKKSFAELRKELTD